MTTRAPFSDLVAAEWIKLRSLRSNYGLLAFGLVFAAVAAYWLGRHVRIAPGAAASFNPLVYPYNNDTWAFLTVLAATFGALSVAAEHSSGLIRATFAAVPARHRVILAKSLVVTLVTAGFGLAASTVSLYLARASLAGQLPGLSLSHPATVRAALLSAALPALGGLIGIAAGTLVRHPAAAVGALWAILLFLPTLLASGTIGLSAATEGMPLSAWMRLAHTQPGTPHPSPLPPVGAAWALMAAWPALALAAAAITVTPRDV